MFFKVILSSILFLSLYSTIDPILINDENDNQENVIPTEERNLQAIENNLNILNNPESLETDCIQAKLELIYYYYYIQNPDYSLIRRLCLSVMNNLTINHQHAPYFLGELYFYGQDVERNLPMALQCYNLVLSQEDISNSMFPGPCNFKALANYRINTIENELSRN